MHGSHGISNPGHASVGRELLERAVPGSVHAHELFPTFYATEETLLSRRRARCSRSRRLPVTGDTDLGGCQAEAAGAHLDP
jgi:hypothetical protein